MKYEYDTISHRGTESSEKSIIKYEIKNNPRAEACLD